jgi:hypothetical protein
LFSLLFGSLALGNILLDFLLLLSRLNSLIRIKFIHKSFILKRIPSLSGMENFLLFLISQNRLDLIRIDDSIDISMSNNFSLESIVSLLSRTLFSSELFSKFSHSTLSIDGESSELTSRSKSSKVKSLYMDNIYSRDISQGSSELFSLVINNNKRTLSESIFLSSDFRNTSSDSLTFNDSLNIFVTSKSLKDSNSLFGLLDIINVIVKD